MTAAEHKSEIESTKDAPYLARTMVCFWELFLENWPRYNGTPLYK